MALSERGARVGLASIVAGLLVVAASTDLPKASGGRFWGDAATYYTMAWSLAQDFDLQYDAGDLERVRREFPEGPEGIFLKRASGGVVADPGGGFPWLRRLAAGEPRIYFAKALAYPLVAAPLVRLLGTRGLLVANAAFLGLALCAGYAELRRRASPAWALAAAAALLLGTVAPLYLFWPTPEAFSVGVIAASLWAWRSGRPLWSAVLLGLAAYTKPYNVLLALPLGLDALVPHTEPLRVRLLEATRRAGLVAMTTLALFGINKGLTGEANYQGGERKTFYGSFPLQSPDVTFGNSGIWMTTNRLGPDVEGEAAARPRGEGPPRASTEIAASFLRNLGYFWVGRFGGVVPYFLPVAVALLLFLACGPRERSGWLGVAALVVSWIFYIRMIPDNWYGGSGTLGNRYFLNLLPLGFLFLPRGRERWIVAAAAVSLGAGLVPLMASPVGSALRPGDHSKWPAFRSLPAELTMLNDLAIFTEPWRKKQPFGDTEGDAHKGWPADPKAYYLYFLDDGTFGREEQAATPGFWLRGGFPAQVVLRALEPVRSLRFEITGGPAGDAVTLRLGGQEQRVAVAAGEVKSTTLLGGAGFPYYDTFLYDLRLRSEGGSAPAAAGGGDLRSLGAFVRISLEVEKRPRPAVR
jgi:hypothetical protein